MFDFIPIETYLSFQTEESDNIRPHLVRPRFGAAQIRGTVAALLRTVVFCFYWIIIVQSLTN